MNFPYWDEEFQILNEVLLHSFEDSLEDFIQPFCETNVSGTFSTFSNLETSTERSCELHKCDQAGLTYDSSLEVSKIAGLTIEESKSWLDFDPLSKEIHEQLNIQLKEKIVEVESIFSEYHQSCLENCHEVQKEVIQQQDPLYTMKDCSFKVLPSSALVVNQASDRRKQIHKVRNNDGLLMFIHSPTSSEHSPSPPGSPTFKSKRKKRRPSTKQCKLCRKFFRNVSIHNSKVHKKTK